VVFNWRFIRFAREQADASIEQARIAKESLEKLSEQINSNRSAQRHAAMAVLREVMNRIGVSAVNFRTDLRSEQNPFRLIPDDWNILVAYVSRHLPQSSPSVSAVSIGLHNVEGELNRLTIIPLDQRRPNSSLQVRYNGLATNLDNVRKLINDINAALVKEDTLIP
jgi:hypothetical protein